MASQASARPPVSAARSSAFVDAPGGYRHPHAFAGGASNQGRSQSGADADDEGCGLRLAFRRFVGLAAADIRPMAPMAAELGPGRAPAVAAGGAGLAATAHRPTMGHAPTHLADGRAGYRTYR